MIPATQNGSKMYRNNGQKCLIKNFSLNVWFCAWHSVMRVFQPETEGDIFSKMTILHKMIHIGLSDYGGEYCILNNINPH